MHVQKYTLNIYIDCDPHSKSHLNENFQPDVNEKQTHTRTLVNTNKAITRSLYDQSTVVPRSRVMRLIISFQIHYCTTQHNVV